MAARVLIFAPRGRDASIAADLLKRNSVEAFICSDEQCLLTELAAGVEAVLLTEEALAKGLPDLAAWVASQETWSDVPFVVLSNGSTSPRTAAARQRLSELGNVVLLERPMHSEALLGAIRSSLRARARQYELRDASERLRESEERLRLAVDNAEIGFWDVDLVHDKLIWPARTKAMFGISPNVPVTMEDFYNGLHPDDRDRTTAAYLAAADPNERSLYDVEYRTIGKEDGKTRWIAAKGRGVFDDAGRCLRVAGTVLDITPRKLAELRRMALVELTQSIRDLDDPEAISYAAAEVLGRALGSARVGYSAVDAEAETLITTRDWTAPGVETLAGVLTLRDYGSFVDDLKAGEFIAIEDVRTDPRTAGAAAAFEAKSTLSFVNVPVVEQGRLVAVFFVNHAEPRGWDEANLTLIKEFADRTRTAVARARGDQALRESEARLRDLNETLEEQVAARSAERDTLWNLSQDMFARADYTGMMSAVSPAWGRVLGWSERELLSRGYATFMHPEDEPGTLEAIGQMAATGQPTRFENRISTRDGAWKYIEWTVVPEADGANFIAVGRDLTHAKAREAELALAQEALRQSQKMEAMGQLTGGVAHDFNNLLTPIIGSLDRLQRKALGDERDRRLIDGAMQSAERARTLVQRLLAFARRQPLQTRAVDIGTLLDGLRDLLESTMGPRIVLTFDVPGDLPSAAADENQIEMAILNLAVNARDAMSDDGGSLSISARLVTADGEQQPDLNPGDYICLSVADTGTGMDEATLARAVEPFFSTKGIGQGTGLGLSMVHGLAAQMGGSLNITSELGRGTQMDFYLPVSEEAASVAPAPSAPESPQESGRILLVDDELLIRMSTAEMLTDLGYRVIEASSAEDALRHVNEGKAFDILVTDHLMPGISGVELASELRKTRPQLPVLIVSGYADIEGVDANIPRLVKPFRLSELATKLDELLVGADA
ncbi:PAS domain-containing protein [Tsuneonella sp. HG222]